MTTSSASTIRVASAIATPPPGALWPAMVTRGSLAYRSDYLQRVPAQNVVNDVEGKNSTLNVDASASYQITDAITLTAEAINLTDEFNDQFVDRDRNSPSVIHHTGRQFYIGARVRF